LYPGVEALEACQDRLSEKDLLKSLGIPVPEYRAVSSRVDLLDAVDQLGLPAVLKTRRLGYDGKGQVILRQQEDLEPAWHQLEQHELILESFVPFQAECSLLAVRNESGEEKFWPLTRNLHANGMLVLSQPGGLGEDLQSQAEHIASRLLSHWNYVGVMAVEFFILQGRLLVNEIAPRVHNSGHWTLDAAETSQFENHLRAVCGLPLGQTGATAEVLMFNWISELPDKAECLEFRGLHWHDYGKSARPGRKLGHASLVASDRAALSVRSQELASRLGGRWPAWLQQINTRV
jgi:5-(carboxyamino)imidazole ribonucleotide synthase